MKQRTWKQTVTILLTICTIMSGLLMNSFTSQAEGESAGTLVYSENFDAATTVSDTKWKITDASGNCTVDVVANPDGEGNVLAVSRTTGNTGKLVATTDEGKNTAHFEKTDKTVLEYRIKATGNCTFFLPTLTYGGAQTNDLVRLVLSEGQLCYQGSDGKNQAICAFSNGEWHTVKLIVDSATPKWELWLDNELVTQQTSLQSDSKIGKQARSIYFGSTNGSQDIPTIYLDDIVAKKYEEDVVIDSNLKYEQDFEETNVNEMPADWSVTDKSEGHVTSGVVESPDGDGNVFALSRTAGYKGTHTIKLKKGLFSTSSQTVLEYRMKATGTATIYMPSLYGENGRLVYLVLQKDSVCYQLSGKNYQICDFTPNEWHTVKLVVDSEKDEWYFYLDDAFIVKNSGLAFPGQASYIQFGTPSTDVDISPIYFDDLVIRESVEGTSVAFDDAPTTLPANNPTQFKLKFTPENTTINSGDFTSSDESIAMVDKNGYVTGLKEGKVTITAAPHLSSLSSISTEVEITVQHATGIVTEQEVTIPVGGHTYLTATVEPDNASYKEVVWESSDENIVFVDEWNELVALKTGTANITASSVFDPGVKTEVAVTVIEPNVMHTIYVSPDGKDTGDGTENDKVSLIRALELIAEKNVNMAGNIEVILADGYYYLENTLEITEAHGGTNNYSVVWKAAEGAEPVIGSGYAIAGNAFTKWTENEEIYVVNVPEWLDSRQLFVDNIRATRARSEAGLTNAGYLFNGETNIGYTCDDTKLADFAKIQDLELVFKSRWTQPRCGVTSIQIVSGKAQIVMDQPGWQYLLDKGSHYPQETGPVWYENALELLDEPGEWYLDTDADKLYYMPRPWESMQNVTIRVPVIDGELITITGSSYDNAAENIRFEGITFADTTWLRPNSENGHADIQNNLIRENKAVNGDVMQTAAVVVQRVNSVSFTNCTFSRLGINALQLIDGVQNCFVIGNDFKDISGDAVNVGSHRDYGVNVPNNAFMKNCIVSNNYIHDIGVDYGSSAAISIAYAANVTSSNNEIFNIPYDAYHVGWGWSTRYANILKNAEISYNFIHDLMDEGIYDGGAIYLLGNSSGDGYNIVKNNYIKNQVNSYSFVLYNDQGTTYWKHLNNVIDLSEPMEKYGERPCWAYMNGATNHLEFRNNYYTAGKVTRAEVQSSEADAVLVENNVECDSAAWPQEALDIIAASGLEENYAYLRNGQAERIKTNLPEDAIILKTNGSFTVEVNFTDGKDVAVSGGDSIVAYRIEDTSIADVSDTGVVTGKGYGSTMLYVYVVSNNILDKFECEVYVGDELAEILLKGVEGQICMSETASGLTLESTVLTTQGAVITPSEVTYTITDETVAKVVDGCLIPVASGSTTLKVEVTAWGMTLSQDFNVVIEEAAQFVAEDLSDIFDKEQEAAWRNPGVVNNNWTLIDDTSLVTSLNGYATFTGRKYQNELMHFKFKIDTNGAGGWPSIVLRADSADSYITKGTSGYIICFGTGALELQRFNGTSRTVIYGNVNNFESLAGGSFAPQPLAHGVEHDVKVGTLNDGDAVRIYLEIDGNVIFDYLDTAENNIKEAGYFGLIGRNEIFTLTKVETVTYNVSFDVELLTGESKVTNGQDYTFRITEPNPYYDYTISATMGGEEATITDNGDNTYTIANVTGDIAITVNSTPKVYQVSFAGTAKEEMEAVEGNSTKATHGADYVFTLPEGTTLRTYVLEGITIDGTAYVGCITNDVTYTIPGADIKGSLVITVTGRNLENVDGENTPDTEDVPDADEENAPDAADTDVTESGNTVIDDVATGDSGHFALWFGLMVAMVVVLATVMYHRNKQRRGIG